MRRAALRGASLSMLLAAASCARGAVAPAAQAASHEPSGSIVASRPASPSAERPEPRWQDALPSHAPIRLGLRPQMLQSDRVYGPLWRHALGVARAQSRVAAGTRLLEAIEHAEEVRVALDAAPRSGDPDANRSGADTDVNRSSDNTAAGMVVVLRGVPGDVDPGTLVDPDGHPLWSAGPFGPVRELVHEQDPDGSSNPASLFELPGRTWVIASGAARSRARDAFARPLGRPEPSFDPDTLALLELDGPELVARVPALRPKAAGRTERTERTGGPLGALGQGLGSIVFELRPGVEHEVRAVLKYEREEHAVAAERTLGDLKGAVERTKPAWLMWYDAAAVVRTVAVVRVDAPLPADLLDGWLRAGAGQPLGPLPNSTGL